MYRIKKMFMSFFSHYVTKMLGLVSVIIEFFLSLQI